MYATFSFYSVLSDKAMDKKFKGEDWQECYKKAQLYAIELSSQIWNEPVKVEFDERICKSNQFDDIDKEDEILEPIRYRHRNIDDTHDIWDSDDVDAMKSEIEGIHDDVRSVYKNCRNAWEGMNWEATRKYGKKKNEFVVVWENMTSEEAIKRSRAWEEVAEWLEQIKYSVDECDELAKRAINAWFNCEFEDAMHLAKRVRDMEADCKKKHDVEIEWSFLYLVMKDYIKRIRQLTKRVKDVEKIDDIFPTKTIAVDSSCDFM